MDFPNQLRQAMGDMTQAELADRTGLRQATISRYLDGSRRPGLVALTALERALPTLRELRAAAQVA